MPDKDDRALDEIERIQVALRESIEQAKDLAEKSARLIKQHRKKTETEE